MFERFDAWLIAGLAVFVLFCGLDAWICGLYRRLKEQKGEIKRLRHELNEARQENTWLIARCESKTDHRVLIRDNEIDHLLDELNQARAKIKEQEVMLDQKWKGAKAK